MVDEFVCPSDQTSFAKLKLALESDPPLALSSIVAIAQKVLQEAAEEKLPQEQLLGLSELSRKILDLKNSVPLAWYDRYIYTLTHEGRYINDDIALVSNKLRSYYHKAFARKILERGGEF